MMSTELIEAGSPKWHAQRATGLGGSDAAAAVGLSRFKTPLQLWLEKRGEATTLENEPMRWGTILEPVVRQEYANRTGRPVVRVGFLRHPTRDYAVGNIDGVAEGDRLLECKTARTAEGWGTPGTDEIPPDYLIQVQHYLAVAELSIADVAVLIGGADFRLYEVAADCELQEMLLDQEAAFWELVQSGTPPEPVNREDVRRRWRYGSGTPIKATPYIEGLVSELRNLKGIVSSHEESVESMAAEIEAYMGDAAELLGETGKPLATWKNVKAQPKFDMDRFKAERPDLWKEYLTDPRPSRRFLLKTKGE